MDYFAELKLKVNESYDNYTCLVLPVFVKYGVTLSISGVGCVMNILAIIGLFSIQHKKPRTFLLLNLVSSHCIVASLTFIYTATFLPYKMEEDTCGYQVAINGLFVEKVTEVRIGILVAIYQGVVIIEYATLLALTVDVLTAVWRPLKHKLIVTKRRICIYLIISWLFVVSYATLLGMLSMIFEPQTYVEIYNRSTLIFTSVMIGVFIIVCIMYFLIFYRIRKYTRMHASSERIQKLQKSAVTIVIIQALFAICNGPICINSLIARGFLWDASATRHNSSLVYWSIASGASILTDAIVEPIVIMLRDNLVKKSLQNVARKVMFCCGKNIELSDQINKCDT